MPDTSRTGAQRPAAMTWILRLDGLMSIAFGLATLFAQYAIFRTAVDLASANVTGDGTSVMEATLTALSGYYLVVGLIALLLASIPRPYRTRLALALGAHHLFMASKGVAEAGHAWVVGNPWWDVAIHTAFVLAYGILLWNQRRG